MLRSQYYTTNQSWKSGQNVPYKTRDFFDRSCMVKYSQHNLARFEHFGDGSSWTYYYSDIHIFLAILDWISTHETGLWSFEEHFGSRFVHGGAMLF